MTAGRDFYVIGVYEDFRLDVFPTHVIPIIAERTAAGFRRWSYEIETPYNVRFVAPFGECRPSADELFPVRTFRLFGPRRFAADCQVIALSADVFLVERRRWVIVMRLLLACLTKLHDRAFLSRTWTTIRNALAP